MPSIILSACVLSFLTVVVHATGIAVLRAGPDQFIVRRQTSLWPILRMLLHMIWWLVLLHLVEISIWGFVLSVAWMPSQRRSVVLLFRCHLHDRWLWRPGAGEAVADARTNRGLDGRPHVRFVHGILLRRREQHPSIAARELHPCFHHGRHSYSPGEN